MTKNIKIFMNNNSIISTIGNTPLVRLTNLETYLVWKGSLWAKCEFLNPTGSFKDRGTITELSFAKKSKKRGVVCASTGNMAASLSLLSSLYDLKCTVIIPKKTSESKLKQTRIGCAEIVELSGSYDDCVLEAENYSKDNNYFLCGDYELRLIGQSTIGIELALSDDVDFDAFIVPVGNGTVGCAIAQGFAVYGKFPKFIGVQGRGADPIYTAWKKSGLIKPIDKPATIASAMNVGNPLDGNLTLEWLKRTNGIMMSVSDEKIVEAKKLLAKTEGLFVEFSAAATVAGLINYKNNNENIVLILTGNGLKE
jgi:threonine synthase